MKVPLGLKKIAAMCVLQHEEQFLLLKRNKAPNKGMYVPVGGKLEPFENPYQAVLRETEEETGIRLSKATFCGTLIETSPTAYNWMCFIYKATIPYCPPPPCDEGSLEWISLKQLSDIPTPPTDWAIYQCILKKQPFAFRAELNQALELFELVEQIEGKEWEV